MTEPARPTQLHASAVALDGVGVLIRGPSGAGKSDLALRLIDAGAVLVADDRVDLVQARSGLEMAPPENLAGLLEVRGVGIIRVAFQAPVPLALVVDLVAADAVPRLPDKLSTELAGVTVRHLALAAFEASSVSKIRLALSAGNKAMLAPS
ncbi:MAG: HPr kinase/phosphatase C-terminal domain-containing protein [Rhodospirillales bacterium]